ncbi:MAG: PDZ domain-containing protein [Thermoanaerobaculia bacterium]|nr:PDZ domain-containing protein [Thermoanaerobaculia bacterium]
MTYRIFPRIHRARIGTVLFAFWGSALLTGAVLQAQPGGSSAEDVSRETHSDELARVLQDRLRQARDEVFPALVSLRIVTAQFRSGKELKSQAAGSGTIISQHGHVLTNEHVTRDGQRFDCILADKRRVAAKLIGEDPLTDLAVLQIDLPPEELAQLPVARFGDSADLEIGDPVMAMGSPYALARSVSLGIVSNTERVFAGGFGNDDLDEMEFGRGQRTGLFTRWIQHDAQISPGNSGGPLVNMAGEIVGVNELGGGNLSFAIPSNLASRIARVLIEHGEVERSWFGLGLRPVAEDDSSGAWVSAVELDGPGHAAGVRAGDLLVAVDGEPVNVRFVEEVPVLLDRLASLPVGTQLDLTLRRAERTDAEGEREERELTVRLETRKLERDVGEELSFHIWGFTGQDITPKMARDAGLESSEGVVVTGVRRGGPAQKAEPPIERGDILLAVDGDPIADLDVLVELNEKLSTPLPQRPLLVEVDRSGRRQLTVLEPSDTEPDDPPRELPKAWIGVATQPVFGELAKLLGLGDGGGFRVTRVYPGTLAANSGLRVGDVVLSFEGSGLAPDGMEDSAVLSRLIRGRDIGSTGRLEVFRDGKLIPIEVELERARLTPEEARRHADTDFEFSARELTFFDRDLQGWGPEVDGVIVENVDAGGWAGLAGLRPGDLLQSLDGSPIGGLRSLRAAMREVRSARSENVEFLVLRRRRSHFLDVEPDWAPSDLEELKHGSDDAAGLGENER